MQSFEAHGTKLVDLICISKYPGSGLACKIPGPWAGGNQPMQIQQFMALQSAKASNCFASVRRVGCSEKLQLQAAASPRFTTTSGANVSVACGAGGEGSGRGENCGRVFVVVCLFLCDVLFVQGFLLFVLLFSYYYFFSFGGGQAVSIGGFVDVLVFK